MNVFVLCTGRSGSVTFAEACCHIDNYAVGHETRTDRLGPARLDYPARHIEVDNRLCWFLGRLEAAYGDEAFYVHLKRDEHDTARSFERRWGEGVIRAYAEDLLLGDTEHMDRFEVCLDYCRTVNANIEHFLTSKPNTMVVHLETAKEDFRTFWRHIGAEGDQERALQEWDVRHNPSGVIEARDPLPVLVGRKIGRVLKKLPAFLKYA